MPRSNSSGPARGRKGSSRSEDSKRPSRGSERPASSGKKFSRPSGFKSSTPGKSSFRKRDEGPGDERSGSKRPFKRSEGSRFEDKKPGFKRRDESSDSGFKKPFKSRREDSGEGSKRPFKSRREDGAEGFKKPFRARREAGDEGSKRPFKARREAGGEGFKGPREDREEGFKKPFKRSEGSGDRRNFSARGERPSRSEESTGPKRPFKRRGDLDAPKSFSGKRVGKSKSYGSGSDRAEGFSGKRRTKAETTAEDAPVQTEKIRLNKYIANSGVCSRREADELITMGLISVNGKTITELGYKVNPGDEVRHESKVLKAEKPVYVLMNKPKGFLTTTVDPQERNTVMHIIGNAVKERIYPVGRLDRNTTGLLLLTNDGDLADKLMHPSYNVKKIYKVELDKPFTKTDLARLFEGVQLEEGKAMVDDAAVISDDRKTVGIEIHIGWNRVVRRIFEALEYQVVKLDRSVYAGLDKKDLSRGQWRMLTKEEVVRLKHYK